MNIIELIDSKCKADIVHEYSESLRSEHTPLVIDNGSYKCRVGWSSCEQPLLEFRNLIAKPRKDRKKEASAEAVAAPSIQIGNDILNIEAVRLQLKTQFDRNVVTQFHNQEKILDYILKHLNVAEAQSFPHPILLTEALANPNYCRQQMNELLFECYCVPAISYGLDAVFSWRRNMIDHKDALIISFGYHTTHVVPMLDGRLQADRVRRLNVGGYHIITFLFRLMQMKYPVHLNAITISRMEALVHQHSTIVVDYMEEMRRWAQAEYYELNVKKIQLPHAVTVQTATLTTEQRNERRKELAKRLIESNARRAKEKQLEDEQQLELLRSIRTLYESGEDERFEIALQDSELADLQALDKLIATVSGRLERMKQKLQETADGTITVPKEKEKSSPIPMPPANMTMETWLADTKGKRTEILKRKHERKIRRQDLAKRHTAAAQERMRIISQLASKEQGSDEFGLDDNDWNVYKVINRDNDSDSETENEKLVECETILRQNDPNFDEPALIPGIGADHYQLHVGVECLRAPELLFQPSMIGSSEAGLAELIQFVFTLFSSDEQLRLANNVFLTGGCAQFSGLKERLSKELLEMRPFQTPHNIEIASYPELDAWLGARDFARSSEFEASLTTKQDYDENGSEYFRAHCASNYFFSSPKQQ